MNRLSASSVLELLIISPKKEVVLSGSEKAAPPTPKFAIKSSAVLFICSSVASGPQIVCLIIPAKSVLPVNNPAVI